MKIQLLESGAAYSEMSDWLDSRPLLAALASCVGGERAAAREHRENRYEPAAAALAQVSAERLAEILDAGGDVHGISTEAEISNVISFNNPRLTNNVLSEDVAHQRAEIDRLVVEKIRERFGLAQRIRISQSGHFWYPPGGYMGWHTNSRFPGWRLYVTHSAEPGKSFFRYRDPVTHEIQTSHDPAWGSRLFYVDPANPFWHAVYSDTDRFSFGYVIHEPSLGKSIVRLARRIGRFALAPARI